MTIRGISKALLSFSLCLTVLSCQKNIPFEETNSELIFDLSPGAQEIKATFPTKDGNFISVGRADDQGLVFSRNEKGDVNWSLRLGGKNQEILLFSYFGSMAKIAMSAIRKTRPFNHEDGEFRTIVK